MPLRKSHGTYADSNPVVVEVLPADELPPLNANDTSAGLALANARGKPFTLGNQAAKNRGPALASREAIPSTANDPRFAKALRWARRYRQARIRELRVQHGGELSAGVCGILTSASLDMASSRYLVEVATETGDADTLKKASALAIAARQHEIAALEIAAREAAARPRAAFDPLAEFEK